MVSFHKDQELDAAEWVDFSKPNEDGDTTRRNSYTYQHQHQHQEEGRDDLPRPPKLSLPLQHYCMIAEKVFISFLRSYRSLYVNGAMTSRDKVTVLGKRLRAFLTVVLPSHSEFSLVDHDKECGRIHDMTRQLDEYLDKLHDVDAGTNPDCMKETRDDFETHSTRTNIASLGESRTLSMSDSASVCGSDSSIFDDLISVKETRNVEEEIKPTSSEEQTFCSSEMSAMGGTREVVNMCDNGKEYEVFHPGTVKKYTSGDDLSICFTEASGFDTSVVWDTSNSSSLSVNGQIGEFYSDECCDRSIQLPDIEPAHTSDASDVSVDYSAGDASWRTDDSNSCETNFESLMKHWKEKEKQWTSRRSNQEEKTAL